MGLIKASEEGEEDMIKTSLEGAGYQDFLGGGVDQDQAVFL